MRSSILAILILAVGMVACRNSCCNPGDLEKEQFASRILHKAASKLKQETDMRPIGTIGQMLHEVQVLGLSFYYYKPIDIIEGRKLLIKAIDALVEEVNQEKQIHPYLITYPFQPQNIEIQIFIRSPDGHDVSPGDLWIVEASDGVLRYRIDHPTTKKLSTIYQETYEEALERIQDPSLPPVPYQLETSKISAEELVQLRKNISMVAEDGSIWRLKKDGHWIKDPKIYPK